jgi:glucuronoarabinoxylan endo-1,4-beta-xylanase
MTKTATAIRATVTKNKASLQRLLALLLIGVFSQQLYAANATVIVDYNQRKQTLAGFGASITWIASDLQNFSAADQTAILNTLYSTTSPSAGLSIIRAGSMLCEFNPSPATYDWNHPLIQGEISWMNRVKSTYGVNQFLVTTWTPPAFMKDNNSCSNGGSVLAQYYPDLANTSVLWLQNAKASLGQDINVWSVQNEPTTSPSYDSANYTPAQFISFVTGHLKPALQNAGLTTKIMVPEPAVYGGASFFDSNWGFPILNDATMRADVDIMATHGYAQTSDLGDPSQAVQQYNKPFWQTEVYFGRSYSGTISDALGVAKSIYRALNLGNLNAWFYWWAMDFSGGNGGVISYSNTAWTYQVPKRAYALGNFSRFIRPGSVMLGSSSTSSNLQVTAVSPTSGTVALVLTNSSKQSITATVSLANLASSPSTVTPFRTSATENQVQLSPIPVGGGTFAVTIPAQSIVTLVG